jgi:hypothetical protein
MMCECGRSKLLATVRSDKFYDDGEPRREYRCRRLDAWMDAVVPLMRVTCPLDGSGAPGQGEPAAAVAYVAEQVGVDPEVFGRYLFTGRTVEYHRAQVPGGVRVPGVRPRR